MSKGYERSTNSFFRWSDKTDAKPDKNGNLFRSYTERCEECKTAIVFIIYDKQENQEEGT